MNNKVIFYSALFIFSSVAVACEMPLYLDPEKAFNIKVFAIGSKYMKSSNKNSDGTHKRTTSTYRSAEYRVVNSYQEDMKDVINPYQMNGKAYCLRDSNIRKINNCIAITDSKKIIKFDTNNTNNLMEKLDFFYNLYKMKNNGWLYNSYAPFYIHLVDNLEDNRYHWLLEVKKAISVELQPQQVEKILGFTSLRNWKIVKGVFFISILALIAKNYSQLMQFVNRG